MTAHAGAFLRVDEQEPPLCACQCGDQLEDQAAAVYTAAGLVKRSCFARITARLRAQIETPDPPKVA